MDKVTYDIISLVIQSFVALGTISAVVVSLWQSRRMLCEKCEFKIYVYTNKNETQTVLERYGETYHGGGIQIYIANTSMRTIHIRQFSIEDIYTKNGIIFDIHKFEAMKSGDSYSRELNIHYICDNKFFKFLNKYKFYSHRLKFTITTKAGSKFRANIPQYIIDSYEKNDGRIF